VADADFARTRIADRSILEGEDIRSAGFVKANDFCQGNSRLNLRGNYH